MVHPIITAIISFLFPGIGQIIQGETQKGIIMFIIAIVISAITWYMSSIFCIVSLIYSIYAAYDAYKMG